jgi:hypothetical protein
VEKNKQDERMTRMRYVQKYDGRKHTITIKPKRRITTNRGDKEGEFLSRRK